MSPCDVNKAFDEGELPIVIAEEEKQWAIVKLLKELGARKPLAARAKEANNGGTLFVHHVWSTVKRSIDFLSSFNYPGQEALGTFKKYQHGNQVRSCRLHFSRNLTIKSHQTKLDFEEREYPSFVI